MSKSFMSHIDLMKRPCHPVKLRDWSLITGGGGGGGLQNGRGGGMCGREGGGGDKRFWGLFYAVV